MGFSTAAPRGAAEGLLLEAQTPVTPEAFVAWCRDGPEMLQLLLQHKADVNACRGRWRWINGEGVGWKDEIRKFGLEVWRWFLDV